MAASVIIQQERGQFLDANGFTAWQGFDERGREIRFFNWEQMAADEVPVAPEVITVGSVGFVHRALRRLGVERPPLDYPAPLAGFLGRAVWRTSWGEVRARIIAEGPPLFVKPVEDDKAFGGYVVAAFRDLIPTAGWPDSMRLWAADPVPFASEWRCFVRRGEVVRVGHYKGDPLRFPDPAVLRAAIDAYGAEAPRAYALDFGIVGAGGTLLVEVNDGFALGCLGLGPLAYSAFLEERWVELVEGLHRGDSLAGR